MHGFCYLLFCYQIKLKFFSFWFGIPFGSPNPSPSFVSDGIILECAAIVLKNAAQPQHMCCIIAALVQHIYSTIAAHLKHHWSTFTALLLNMITIR